MEKDLALAALAHDLNNVLQTVAQVAELLPESCAAEASMLFASVGRGRSILESMQEEASRVPLADVARRAVEGADGLLVRVDVDDALAFAGKPLAFERALLNLLWNSRRAGATEVRIAAEVEPGGAVAIEVADNGPGIRAADLSRVFDRGFSGTASTGLGLKIVESIVESHGGSIEVFNRGGACFHIRIPA